MRDVASHTAADIQELLTREPKTVMRSLDQVVEAIVGMAAESRASEHKATRYQSREREGQWGRRLAINHTNTT